MSILFLPYDTYERHKRVGEFVGNGKSIVDIGGQLNMLSKFCNVEKIVVANLQESEEKSDIKIKKNTLPFKKDSFDIACAIDVLEHMPKNKRKKFITNLTNIAKEKIVVSFPIGTGEHIAYEKELETWLKSKGQNVDYLKEHIKFGLPTKVEVEEMTTGLKSRQFFSGNLFINEIIFKLFIFDPKIPLLGKIIYLIKQALYFLTNPFLYAILANKPYSKNVVRAYLVIEK